MRKWVREWEHLPLTARVAYILYCNICAAQYTYMRVIFLSMCVLLGGVAAACCCCWFSSAAFGVHHTNASKRDKERKIRCVWWCCARRVCIYVRQTYARRDDVRCARGIRTTIIGIQLNLYRRRYRLSLALATQTSLLCYVYSIILLYCY